MTEDLNDIEDEDEIDDDNLEVQADGEDFSAFLEKNKSQRAARSVKGGFCRHSIRTTLSNVRLEGGIVLTEVKCILREYNARSHFHALERFLEEMKEAVGGSEKEALEKCKAIFGDKIEIAAFDGKKVKTKKMSF